MRLLASRQTMHGTVLVQVRQDIDGLVTVRCVCPGVSGSARVLDVYPRLPSRNYRIDAENARRWLDENVTTVADMYLSVLDGAE